MGYIIRVQSMVLEPTEKGQKKLDSLIDRSQSKAKTDENGKTADWYEDVGLPVPEELEEEGFDDLEVYLTLEDKELSVSYKDSCFNTKYLVAIVDNKDPGSTIYLNGDIEMLVKETEEEIHELIQKEKYKN